MVPETRDVLAVVCQFARTLSFRDIATGDDLGVIELAAEPHEATFDARRRLIYVSHTYHGGWYSGNSGRTSMISVVDADVRQLIDVIDISPDHGPHDVYWDASTDVLFATIEAGEDRSAGVVMIDPDTRRVRRRIPLAMPAAHWFAFSPDASTIYTANKESPFVSVVDVASGRESARIVVPSSEGIAALGDGRRVVVAGPMLGSEMDAAVSGLRVIDTTVGVVTEVIETDVPVQAVHATSGGLLLVSTMPSAQALPDGIPAVLDGVLQIYDAQTLALRAELPIGAGALTVRSSADGSQAFVANIGSGTVDVIDLVASRIVRTDLIGAGAHGLAVVPAED